MPKVAINGRGWIAGRMRELLPLRGVEIVEPTDSADWVVDCGGHTGRPNVDACESEKGLTAYKNIVERYNFAASLGCPVIVIGSGCLWTAGVYDDHARPSVQDFPSWYSASKAMGEAALEMLPRATIARIRMPVDFVASPKNLLNKLIGYETVIDSTNSVTSMDLLAEFCAGHPLPGVWNVVNPVPITPYWIAEKAYELGLRDKPIRATLGQLQTWGKVRTGRSNVEMLPLRARELLGDIETGPDVVMRYLRELAK